MKIHQINSTSNLAHKDLRNTLAKEDNSPLLKVGHATHSTVRTHQNTNHVAPKYWVLSCSIHESRLFLTSTQKLWI